MGSPLELIGPMVANLYMEHLDREALWSVPTPPRHWLRYVDYTFLIKQQANKKYFGSYKYIDPAIQFTVKGNQDNGAISSWIPWSHPRHDIPSLLQYTVNPPILTSTNSGIAKTQSIC